MDWTADLSQNVLREPYLSQKCILRKIVVEKHAVANRTYALN